MILGITTALLCALSLAVGFPTSRHIVKIDSRCADPTYSCQDLATARSCGVVKSCVHDIWATMAAPDDDSDICALCKEMVKEARDQLLSNMTQEEIKEVFEGTCNLIPLKIFDKACIKVVDEMIPDMIEMLASRMDPTMVCTVSGLCNVAHNSILEKVFKKGPVTDDNCNQCVNLASSVKQVLSSLSETQLQQLLNNFCAKQFGPTTQACEDAVATYLPIVYSYIVSMDPNDICKKFGLCTSTYIVKKPVKKVGTACDICEDVIQEMKTVVTNNATEEEFKDALLFMCNELGGFSSECKVLIKTYYSQFYSYIVKELNPQNVCTALHLCSSIRIHITDDECTECVNLANTVKQVIGTHSESDLQDIIFKFCQNEFGQEAELCEDAVSNYLPVVYNYIITMNPQNFCQQLGACTGFIPQPLIKNKDDLTCEFCESLVQHLKDIVSSNTTEEEFKTALINMCHDLGSFSTECSSLVTKYYSQIYNLIVNTLNPQEACTLMGLCQSSVAMMKTKPALPVKTIPALRVLPAQSVERKTKFDNKIASHHFVHPNIIFERDTECAFCKAMTFFLKEDLKESRSKPKVKKTLDKVCDGWLNQYSDYCNSFMEKHYIKLQTLLVGEKNFDNVCDHLKVCYMPESVPQTKVISSTKVKSEIGCDLCKQVVNILDQELKKPTTENGIKTALDYACSILPTNLKTKCQSFINENVDLIISILVQEITPAEICDLLNLCSDSTFVLKQFNDMECDMCKSLITSLKQELTNPQTVTAVKQVLDRACALLPGSMAQDCETFVNKNVDTVINILSQELDPDTVCEALKLCPSSKLNLHKSSVKSDLECQLCQQVAQMLEKELQNPSTETEIKNALDHVCSLLPSNWGSKCQDFINQNTDMIISILVEELNPSTICDVLKMCTGSKLSLPKSSIKSDLECELCQQVAQMLEKELQNPSTENDIQNALDRVCSLLPSSWGSKCQDFINQNTDMIINILVQELSPSVICDLLKVCTDAQLHLYKSSIISNIECDLCKEVAQKLEDTLENPSTEAEIKDALDRVCSLLPTNIGTKCQNFINQNTEQIVAFLVQELNPTLICDVLKMCPASAASKVILKKNQSVKDDVECELCKSLFTMLKQELANPQIAVTVQNALNKVCTLLPENMRSNCVNLVDNYVEGIIAILMQELDPNTICPLLKLCQAQIKPTIKGIECNLCKKIVSNTINNLKDNKTEEAIRIALDGICSNLQASYVVECKQFVDNYTRMVINMIAQDMDADSVCSVLDMCSSMKIQKVSIFGIECKLCEWVVERTFKDIKDNKTEEKIRKALNEACTKIPFTNGDKCQDYVNRNIDSFINLITQDIEAEGVCAAISKCDLTSFECTACQDFFHFFQERLNMNETQNAVLGIAKRLCTHLPKQLAENCDAFVEEYGRSLLIVISQKLDPSVVCVNFGVCTAKYSPVAYGFRYGSTSGSSFCEVCKVAVDELDKLIERDDIDQEIASVVDKVCNVLPSSIKDKCSSVLEAYVPYILQMIGQLANSEEVCQAVDLCPRTAGHVHLLGGPSCTYGPSYWCKSKAHAAACKAEMYCTQKVWKN